MLLQRHLPENNLLRKKAGIEGHYLFPSFHIHRVSDSFLLAVAFPSGISFELVPSASKLSIKVITDASYFTPPPLPLLLLSFIIIIILIIGASLVLSQ